MRRVASVLVSFGLVLGIVGSASGGAASTAAKLPKAGDKYVSLGSSIASGFGLAVQSPTCGRSDRNYPQLVAKRLKLDLVDVSCGAASVPHVLTGTQAGNPPQITAVTPDTKLITVAVGGNDIGYNGTAVGCGDPATVCSAPATLDSDITTARQRLTDMLDQLEAAAPSATIVFVTYPREVPRHDNCAALSFTDAEYDIIRSMGEKLEQIFLDVAKRPGVVFVDPYAVKGDHTACAKPSQQWTAGHEVTDGFAYHPTALGHRVMAKMIIKALKKH